MERLRLSLGAVLFLALFELIRGDCLTSDPLSIISATDKQLGDNFGASVSVSGTRAAIGARGVDAQGVDSGAVYVFNYEANEKKWEMETKLLPHDGSIGDDFGLSVAISSGVIIAGAHKYDMQTNVEGAGTVYVFVYGVSGWTETQKLMAVEPSTDDLFGHSVALSGSVALIGSQFDDEAALDAGAVYIYENVGQLFVMKKKLTPNASSGDYENANFGFSTALHNNVVVVGAPRAKLEGVPVGSAFVFEFDGESWVQVKELTPDGAGPQEGFGSSVSIHRGLIAVGSRPTTGSGIVVVYEKIEGVNGIAWEKTTTLVGEDSWFGDKFGYSVSVYSGVVVAGAPFADFPGHPDKGAAYVFSQCNGLWTQASKLWAHDDYHMYGSSVSIGDEFALVGHPIALGSGAVNFIELDKGFVDFVPEKPDVASDGMKATFYNRFLAGLRELFGASVAAGPSLALVGAPSDVVDGVRTGSVAVMEKVGEMWLQKAKLYPQGGVDGALFGHSVAYDGDFVVVGAIGIELPLSGIGAAYVFQKEEAGTYIQKQILASFGAEAQDDYFGFSVAIANGYIAVGAPLRSADSSNSGAVYVYKFEAESWLMVQSIDGSAGARFGYSIGLSHEVLVVGSPFENDDDRPLNSGAAYIYRRNETGQFSNEEKVLSSESVPLTQFGRSVAVSQSTVVIGSKQSNDGAGSSGGAHVFDTVANPARLEGFLTAEEHGGNSRVNGIVSISGGVVIVGGSTVFGGHSVGYVFTRSESAWMMSQVLEDPEVASSPTQALAVSENFVLVGIPNAHGVTLYNLGLDAE